VADGLVAHENDLGYIAAAWVVTAVALGAYVAGLLARARRARLRAEAIVARRDSIGRPRPGPATTGPPTAGSGQ
jgi:hypothetical protein